jgi:hypothetical protein
VGEDWKPQPGAVVLIEPDVDADAPITAIALLDDDGRVLLDVGASPTPSAAGFAAVASVFAPDRMFRITGKVRQVDPDRTGVYELVADAVEQVERRSAPRRHIELPASLTALDGPGAAVSTVGHTEDLSSGGCRVVTAEPFPMGFEPTVSLQFDDGTTVLARAAILERRKDADGFHYRLMFTDIDLEDRVRVAELVAA